MIFTEKSAHLADKIERFLCWLKEKFKNMSV